MLSAGEAYSILGAVLTAVSIFQWVAYLLAQRSGLFWMQVIKWSSMLYIPIGVLAAIGAQRVIDEQNTRRFQERRNRPDE